MNSGGHRGVTVVTVITLVFAPVFNHHFFFWRLVGKTKETHIEQCATHRPCPARRREVKIVTLPGPDGTPRPHGAPPVGDDDN